MCSNCASLKDIKLEGILENVNESRIEAMEEMFYNCKYLNNFTLENINILELTNMERILYDSFTIYYSSSKFISYVNFLNIYFSKSI